MPSISDEIRLALDKPDGVSEEIMTPLAAQYDQQVAAVNERLDEAVMLLRKNLRSEAIQSANRRPNVLDSATGLDFPEVGEWQEILQFLGVAVPRRLDLEKIQMINEAIVEGQPIEILLRQHRRLAIARAPLNWRLVVLRRIADADPLNPVWMDDVESYERERLKTLRGDVEAAIAAEDLNAVHHLNSELTAQQWVTDVPADLGKSLGQFIRQSEYESQIDEMRRLAVRLHDAFSGFDEAAARGLADQWVAQSGELKGPMPGDLEEEVAPTFEWLRELDQIAVIARERGEAIGKFERLLDQQRDLATLHKGYMAVARFDEPIPAELDQRYRVLTEQIALTAKRKTQFKVVSVVAATILIGSAVVFWQFQSMRQALITETNASFSKLVKDRRTAEAAEFWAKTEAKDASLLQHPEMVQYKEQLDTLIAKEAERKREFEAYLVKADSEQGESIDEKALNEAESLALTEEEKGRVFAVQSKLDDYLKELAVEHNKKALAEVARIRGELTVIEALDFEDLDLDDLDQLIVGLQEISRLYPRRKSEVDAQIRLVQTKAENLEGSVQAYRRAEMVRRQARRPLEAAKSIDRYHDALTRYARTIESTSLASELTRAAEDLSRWQQGMTTNDLSKLTRTILSGNLEPDDLQDLLSLVRKVEQGSERNPLLDQFTAVVKYFDESSDARGDALENFRQRFKRLAIKDLVTVLAADSRSDSDQSLAFLMYIDDYQRSRSNLAKEGSMGIKVISNSNGGIASSIVDGPMERAHIEPGATYAWLEEQFNDIDDFETNFESTLIRVTQAMTRRIDLDYRVKEMLLVHLMKCGVDGSKVLEEQWGDSLAFLESRKQSQDLWYVPQVPNDQLEPVIQLRVIDVLEKAAGNLPNVRDSLEQLKQKEYRFVGFLDRSELGAVQAVVHTVPAANATAFVMRSALADPTQVSVVSIGKWVDGELELDEGNSELNAGRPIFFISE